MTSLLRTLERVLKGPIGGMFMCLLIAGFLGGVAVAHPGGSSHKQSPTTSPSDDPSETPRAPEAPEQDQASGAPSGGGTTHTPGDCQGKLTSVQGQLPAVQDATGLAHAIWIVEANCEKNPQAPGLVNALGHLVFNWQRHQDHEAAKATREHGPPAVHGNAGSHGHSGEHGNSGHGSPNDGGGEGS